MWPKDRIVYKVIINLWHISGSRYWGQNTRKICAVVADDFVDYKNIHVKKQRYV